MNLKLDSAGDILVGRQATRISGQEYLAQLIKTTLMTDLGEWEHDTSIGMPWTSYVFRKGASPSIISGLLTSTILSVDGVVAVTSMQIDTDFSKRTLTVNFTVRGIDGNVTGELTHG